MLGPISKVEKGKEYWKGNNEEVIGHSGPFFFFLGHGLEQYDQDYCISTQSTKNKHDASNHPNGKKICRIRNWTLIFHIIVNAN